MKTKATIVNLTSLCAVVMTEDCEFVRILRRPGMNLGSEIIINKKESQSNNWSTVSKTPKYKPFLAAGILAILIAGFILFKLISGMFGLQSQIFAYIDVDINPSVSFAIDANEKVLNAIPLNEDAKELLENTAYKGKPITDAIISFTKRAQEMHFDYSFVLISGAIDKKIKNTGENEEKLQDVLLSIVNNNKLKDYQILSQAVRVSPELNEEARHNGISLARQAAYKNATRNGSSISLDQIRNSETEVIFEILSADESNIEKGEILDAEQSTSSENSQSAVSPHASEENDHSASEAALPTPSPTAVSEVTVTPAPTPSPSSSVTPTFSPTPNPTPSPTPNPTPNPTPSPTPNPTPHPTPHPTPNPTPYPTPHPTPNPTPHPTPSPTPSPTPHPTPLPITKATVTAYATDSGIQLSWNKVSADEFKYYKVVVSKNNPHPAYPGDGYLTYITDNSITTYTVKPYNSYNGGDFGGKIQPGETYYFSITAVYDYGKIRGNSVQIKMPGTLPPESTPKPNITFSLSSNIVNGNLVLSWNQLDPDDFSFYKVVISKYNSSPVYPDDGYLYYIEEINQTSVTINLEDRYNNGDFGGQLISGEKYYFSITAVYRGKKIKSNVLYITCP